MGGVLTSKVLGEAETLGGFGITGVGNNQTGNPMVSPGRLQCGKCTEDQSFQKKERCKVPRDKGFLHWYSQDLMPLTMTRPKVH